MKDRLTYYDGVRGLAALWVALIHFFCAFCWPEIKTEHLGLYDIFLRFLLNGELCVYIFWLLSGIVISYRFLHSPQPPAFTLSAFPVKRYVRLTIPAFGASLLAFLLLVSGCNFMPQAISHSTYGGDPKWASASYNLIPTVTSFIKTSLFDVYLTGNSSYDPPLWTIGPELFGPIAIGCLALVYAQSHNRLFHFLGWLVLIWIGGTSSVTFYHYMLFVVGLLLAHTCYGKTDNHIPASKPLKQLFSSPAWGWLLLALSLLAEWAAPQPRPWQYFFVIPLRAVSIIIILRNSSVIRNILSQRPLQWLGRMSYPIYLLHFPLLYSVIAYIFTKENSFFSGNVAWLLCIYVGILLPASWVFYKIAEVPAVRLASRAAAFVVKKDDQKEAV